MSTNNRQFYCHECRAQMIPLMTPEPTCSSCHGSFVEELNPNDTNPDHDPRNFVADDDEEDELAAAFARGNGYNGQSATDRFISTMASIMEGLDAHQNGRGSQRQAPDPISAAVENEARRLSELREQRAAGGASPPGTSSSPTIRIYSSAGLGRGTGVTFTSASSSFGGQSRSPDSLGGERDGLGGGPTAGGISLFDLLMGGGLGGGVRTTIRTASGPGSPGSGDESPPRAERAGINPLLSLLLGGGGLPRSGQMGDYVLDQHALDEVITRLMDANQGSRPNPAPDDMIEKLPRWKITADSPVLDHDCAICKETFTVETTETLVTLPCSENPKYQHSFHEECIVPWLKQNGTCPVCRFHLVPQPEHHNPPPRPSDGDNNNNSSNGDSSGTGGGGATGGGAGATGPLGLGGLLGLLAGIGATGSGGSTGGGSRDSEDRPNTNQSSNTNTNPNANNPLGRQPTLREMMYGDLPRGIYHGNGFTMLNIPANSAPPRPDTDPSGTGTSGPSTTTTTSSPLIADPTLFGPLDSPTRPSTDASTSSNNTSATPPSSTVAPETITSNRPTALPFPLTASTAIPPATSSNQRSGSSNADPSRPQRLWGTVRNLFHRQNRNTEAK